ncbi:O-antigen ligase [Microbacterium marinum]|uniref:O-antigen ligase n=1 Tax=Microbacterium marinum TaxID=421115 RepID=A0A7W7BNX3_9MICO|nr:O-antigen ligase [Microbacterium marinum]
MAVVIFTYVLLWGLEGAARKWLPGADQLFYLLRDGLLLISIAWVAFVVKRPRRRSRWVVVFWLATLLLVALGALSVLAETNTVVGAALGARAYLAPVLLVLFISQFGTADSISTIRRAIFLLVMVNLPVVTVQVLSPVGAAINLQVGGDESIFVNGGTTVRASGTFSAPAGLLTFVGLGVAVALGGLGSKSERSRSVVSLLGLLFIAVLSGSRGAILQSLIVLGVFLLISLIRGSMSSTLRAFGIVAAACAVIAASAIAFPTVIDSFRQRFIDASQSEDTSGRILNDAFGFLTAPFVLIGDGPGSHQIAAVTVTGGQWIEVETLRWTAELGVIGFALAIFKLGVALWAIAYLVTRAAAASMQTVPLVTLLAYTATAGSLTQQPSVQGGVAILIAATWLSIKLDARNSLIHGTYADGEQHAMEQSAKTVASRRAGIRRLAERSATWPSR